MVNNCRRILSAIMSLIMVISMFAGLEISSFAENNSSGIAQEILNIDIPENEFKKLDLPFEWNDVKGYNEEGKYQIFLTVDSYKANNDESYCYSYVINYKIYYTEDFETWKTAEFSLNTADYADNYESWEAYGYEIDFFLDYNYKITMINENGAYYIPISCNGEPHGHFTVGVVFDNGNITFMDPEIAKENVFVLDDGYVMVNNDMYAVVTDLERITINGEEKYKISATFNYYYSEDFETWSERQGPVATTVCDYYPNGAFYAHQGYNSIYFMYSPYEMPMYCPVTEYVGPFVSTDGKHFIEFEKTAEGTYPSFVGEINDKYFVINAIYDSETDMFMNYQLESYDNAGKATILKALDQIADGNQAWLVKYADSGEITFSLSKSDSLQGFVSTDVFDIDSNLNVTHYVSAFDVSNSKLTGSSDFNDGDLCIALFGNYIDGSIKSQLHMSYTSSKVVYVVTFDEDFSIADTFGDNLILFGSTSYMVSKDAIEKAINEVSEENATQKPDTEAPETGYNCPHKSEIYESCFLEDYYEAFCINCGEWIKEPIVRIDHNDTDNDGYCDNNAECGMYVGELDEDTVVKGFWGYTSEDVDLRTYWTLKTDGTMIFSGDTDMAMLLDIVPLYERYADSVTDVIFENGITAIRHGCIHYFSNVKKITFPDTVTALPVFVCTGCTSLEEVHIPASVTSIALGAFSDCESLKTVYFYGTEEQWSEIEIGTENECLLNAEIIFVDSAESDIKVNGDSITVDEENNMASFEAGKSADEIAKILENENFAIVDKDGNELDENSFVGTGSKIQIKDNNGNVVSEYVVMVRSDVDGNGEITASDARKTLRASASLDELNGVYATAADNDGNNELTASDARKILRKSAGLE